MPIDPAKVIGAPLHAGTAHWDQDDVILYHLGIGAGVPATDDNELSYTYEARLKVLPSFAVLPAFSTIAGALMIDGVQVNPMLILHGEQSVTIHNPIPTSAKVTNSGKVTAVYDKGEGKGAVIVAEVESQDENGTPLF